MAPAHPRTPVPAHVAHGPTELSPASPAPAAAPDARAHTPRRSQLDRFMHTCLTVGWRPENLRRSMAASMASMALSHDGHRGEPTLSQALFVASQTLRYAYEQALHDKQWSQRLR